MTYPIIDFTAEEAPLDNWRAAQQLGEGHSPHPNYIKNGPLRECKSYWLKNIETGFRPSFSATETFIRTQMAKLGKTEFRLGRVYYTTLPSMAIIHEHSDEGPYFDQIDRYQAFLELKPGHKIQQKDARIKSFSIAHFTHGQRHGFYNCTEAPWTFLVFDIYKP